MSGDGLFPPLTHDDVLKFQFSSWYSKFRHITFKSTIVRPLSDEFRRYLDSDGVHIPEGSENVTDHSSISDDEDEDSADSEESDASRQRFAFPELDAQIREAVKKYEAVFPKLNFSSPKDAAWILPSSSPLKCTSPMDVYMLLKSSDFVTHDCSPETVFEGCKDGPGEYELELVLRKWYHVDSSREFRCFVRSNRLLGITQRDPNYYDYMNDDATRSLISNTILGIWEREIQQRWVTTHYVFDILLTRDLESGHIIDFNPYAPRTDSLLFSYDELLNLHHDEASNTELKVVNSASHASATRNAPANLHNMVPFELLDLSVGETIDDFSRTWEDKIQDAMKDPL